MTPPILTVMEQRAQRLLAVAEAAPSGQAVRATWERFVADARVAVTDGAPAPMDDLLSVEVYAAAAYDDVSLSFGMRFGMPDERGDYEETMLYEILFPFAPTAELLSLESVHLNAEGPLSEDRAALDRFVAKVEANAGFRTLTETPPSGAGEITFGTD